MNFRTIVLSLIVFGSGLLSATKYSGKLVNHEGKPLNNAVVKVRGLNLSKSTNDQGEFNLELAPGQYTLDIKAGASGHFHQPITVGETEQSMAVIHVDNQHERKVVITANPLEHTKLDMASPAIVLSGDELIMKRSSSIGDMLQLEPGMSVSSFGPAVSRPVIRGLSGGRVLMTTNQMTVQDASTTSADHDVSLEPLLATQVEVLKGPATLLYGSGAIGGVVNVTDKRINPLGSPVTEGGIEARLGDSATGERSFVATVNGGSENFAWHFDAFSSEFDDIEIPGEAESEALHEAEGHEEQEEEHAGEEHEEGHGVLENSRSESDGASAGFTWNGDWGYFGIAVNQLNKLYGVPGHAHHEEEHTEEETAEEEHQEEHEEGVFIDLEQTRWDLQGQINNPFANVDEWFIGASFTDYQHIELEGDERGTLFDNQAMELRSYMKHSVIDNWEGIWGFQFNDRDFSAIGDEAFVPPSQTESAALFVVEEKRFGDWKLELGARLETQSVNADNYSKKSFTTTSLSVGSVYDLSSAQKLAFNLSQAERAPSVEELFSFGEHAATQTFEIGNPQLDKEVAYNLDLSWRFNNGSLNGEINAYWNQFHDFIYGEYRNNTGAVIDFDGQSVLVEEDLPIVAQRQDSAAIRGVEIQLNHPLLDSDSFALELGLMADFLEAELDSGAYIPRMPPLKYGINLQFSQESLSADLHWTRYQKQDHLAQGELPTEGFNMVDFELAYRLINQNHDALFFLRGKNLLDEEARDHASFLKDLAPRAGRNLVAGIRYKF